MVTIFAVMGSNLAIACFEEKNVCFFATDLSIRLTLLTLLFVTFRFYDDVFHKWLIQFNFYKIMNELDSDL